MSAFTLGLHIMKQRLSAGRMLVIWPLLAMFILFSSWGLSDPKANLPAELIIDSAKKRRLYGYIDKNSWFHIGTVKDLESFRVDYK